MDDRYKQFETTRWSLVLRARGEDRAGQEALEDLCRAYWYPLYSYARQRGRGVSDAEDAVQSFFGIILQRRLFAVADPTKGRLRTFLLTAFQHYLRDQHQRETAQKRGGRDVVIPMDVNAAEGRYRIEPIERETPEQIFMRSWAISVLNQATERLAAQYRQSGREAIWVGLRSVIKQPDAKLDYPQLAHSCGLSESAARVAVHRLRDRFGKLLREVVRETVEDDHAVDDELTCLMTALARQG